MTTYLILARIADRTKPEGWVEKFEVYEKPTPVEAHQFVTAVVDRFNYRLRAFETPRHLVNIEGVEEQKRKDK